MNTTFSLLANEKALAARAADEPDAFAPIYDHYFPRVYNYIRYRVVDPSITDELTAATFERALRHIHTYRPERAPLGAWLFAIARHTLENHFRAERRRKWLPWEWLSNTPTGAPLPEEIVSQGDTRAQVLAAVARLKDRERDLLALKFSSGLDNVEIARLTGLSESHVGVILYRALRQIRALLKQQEITDEIDG